METRDRKSLFLRQTEFALFKSQKKNFLEMDIFFLEVDTFSIHLFTRLEVHFHFHFFEKTKLRPNCANALSSSFQLNLAF